MPTTSTGFASPATGNSSSPNRPSSMSPVRVQPASVSPSGTNSSQPKAAVKSCRPGAAGSGLPLWHRQVHGSRREPYGPPPGGIAMTLSAREIGRSKGRTSIGGSLACRASRQRHARLDNESPEEPHDTLGLLRTGEQGALTEIRLPPQRELRQEITGEKHQPQQSPLPEW
jgi:hypothetical protein